MICEGVSKEGGHFDRYKGHIRKKICLSRNYMIVHIHKLTYENADFAWIYVNKYEI